MIIVILKDGYAFGFEMNSFEKEKALINRFKKKQFSATTILDLKSRGRYKVEDIQDLEFNPVKILR